MLPSPKKLIYARIAERGVVSKADLLAAGHLTSSTLTRLLDEMIGQALIRGTNLGPSSGGRRPILYQINPDYGYIFGLDISRFTSALGLFDMQLNPKSLVRWRMDETMTPSRFVRHTIRQMKSFLKDHRIEPGRILGVGIGAVGPLDRNTGLILDPIYFPAAGWSHVPICDILGEETGWKVRLENGAHAALIGEQWAMRHEHVQHALYVNAGVSLRSALMSYGQIVHGAFDMEGSIGQMIIQANGERLHESGNYGALEAYASITALLKQARAQAKMGRELPPLYYGPTPERIHFDGLVQALEAGEPYANELFRQAAVYFGIGLANLINSFHPEKIILGGALVNSNKLFFETAAEVARKNTYHYPQYQPQFSKGELKEDAVVTGAALTVWKASLP